MLRPVYSTAFIQATSSAPDLDFEVPPGFTAVIRQITACQQAGAFDLGVYIQDSVDAPQLNILAVESSGTFNMVQEEGRWVVPPNGFISASVSTFLDGGSFYVGGYLLTGTLPG